LPFRDAAGVAARRPRWADGRGGSRMTAKRLTPADTRFGPAGTRLDTLPNEKPPDTPGVS
jgi:hypothetical protein